MPKYSIVLVGVIYSIVKSIRLPSLGLALGDTETLALGDFDGLTDGLALGEIDTLALGLSEGDTDGLSLGEIEADGLIDGDGDGL